MEEDDTRSIPQQALLEDRSRLHRGATESSPIELGLSE
jgi:hypothetical protein